MSDRIVELLRQKQLLQEHLNWLDKEIARAATSTNQAPPVPLPKSSAPAVIQAPTPSVAPVIPEHAPADIPPPVAPISTTTTSTVAGSEHTSEAMRKADEILARYQQEEALQPEDTKRGCMVLAAAVFALMGIAFLVSYWFFYKDRM